MPSSRRNSPPTAISNARCGGQRLAVLPDAMGSDTSSTPDLGVRFKYDHTPTRDDAIAATGRHRRLHQPRSALLSTLLQARHRPRCHSRSPGGRPPGPLRPAGRRRSARAGNLGDRRLARVRRGSDAGGRGRRGPRADHQADQFRGRRHRLRLPRQHLLLARLRPQPEPGRHQRLLEEGLLPGRLRPAERLLSLLPSRSINPRTFRPTRPRVPTHPRSWTRSRRRHPGTIRRHLGTIRRHPGTIRRRASRAIRSRIGSSRSSIPRTRRSPLSSALISIATRSSSAPIRTWSPSSNSWSRPTS